VENIQMLTRRSLHKEIPNKESSMFPVEQTHPGMTGETEHDKFER